MLVCSYFSHNGNTMLLIADSGSSKTDWRLVTEEGKTVGAIQTPGLNPYFLSVQEIAAIIKEQILPIAYSVDKVYFYGAGCGLPQKIKQVKEAIQYAFPALTTVEVAGDILGAARSLLQDKPGVCCILGTGANSCVYDGANIIDNVPSLGYILADWGGGSVLSKDFISLLLQEKLPSEITEDFRETFGYDRQQILDNIYNKPLANRYLASFTPFLLKYAENALCKEIIYRNFQQFFAYYVQQYKRTMADFKVGMVGSVAFHFSRYLLDVAGSMDISVEKIVKNPMEGLVQYHCLTLPLVRS